MREGALEKMYGWKGWVGEVEIFRGASLPLSRLRPVYDALLRASSAVRRRQCSAIDTVSQGNGFLSRQSLLA